MAPAAAAASAKDFVFDCPGDPMRPHRVVISLPFCETSQNLLELPSTNSKQRGVVTAPLLAVAAILGTTIAGLEDGLRFASWTATSVRTPTQLGNRGTPASESSW